MQKTLVCVDVQQEYSKYIHNWSSESLGSLLRQSNSIYCIYDTCNHRSSLVKPVYTFQHHPCSTLYKRYDNVMYDIPLEDDYVIETMERTYIDSFVEKKKYLENLPFLSTFYLVHKETCARCCVLKVNTLHKFVEITQGIAEFFMKLPQSFYMIGGGWKECLHDMYYIAEFYKKEPQIIEEFTY